MGVVLGQRSYKKWQKGKKLTRKHQIFANCYQCNGFEESGVDCGGEKTCPLYPYSPSMQRSS